MNKWLSIGVTPELVYKDWERINEELHRLASKQFELESKREENKMRQDTQRENYRLVTMIRLGLLPLDWFTPDAAAKIWGQSVSHARKRLAQLMVAGHLEQRRNGKNVEYRRVVL